MIPRPSQRIFTLWYISICVAGAAASLSGCGKADTPTRDKRLTTLTQQQSVRARQAAQTFFSIFFNEVQRGRLSASGRQDLRAVTTPAILTELVRASENVRHETPPCRTNELLLTPRQHDSALAETIVTCGGKELAYGVELSAQRQTWVVRDLRDARFDTRGRCTGVTCGAPAGPTA